MGKISNTFARKCTSHILSRIIELLVLLRFVVSAIRCILNWKSFDEKRTQHCLFIHVFYPPFSPCFLKSFKIKWNKKKIENKEEWPCVFVYLHEHQYTKSWMEHPSFLHHICLWNLKCNKAGTTTAIIYRKFQLEFNFFFVLVEGIVFIIFAVRCSDCLQNIRHIYFVLYLLLSFTIWVYFQYKTLRCAHIYII